MCIALVGYEGSEVDATRCDKRITPNNRALCPLHVVLNSTVMYATSAKTYQPPPHNKSIYLPSPTTSGYIELSRVRAGCVALRQKRWPLAGNTETALHFLADISRKDTCQPVNPRCVGINGAGRFEPMSGFFPLLSCMCIVCVSFPT